MLGTHFDEYYDLLNAKRSKIDCQYDPANLALDEYDYSEWSGLELRKKYCFVKKLDNNVQCCARSASTVAMRS